MRTFSPTCRLQWTGPLAWIALPLVLLITVLGRAPARSEGPVAQSPILQQVGFDGLYKLGRWTPATVEFTTDAPVEVQFALEAPDPYGSIAVFPTEKITFSAGTHKITGYFQNGRLGGRIRPILQMTSEQGDVPIAVPVEFKDEVPPPLTQGDILMATLGNPAGLEEPPDGAAAAPLYAVDLANVDQLPADAVGYDSLNALIISGDYGLSPERSEALRRWVQQGGHLVVSAGEGVGEYVESPLAQWIPISVAAEPQSLRELSGLESFAGRNERLIVRGPVSAARIEQFEGRELVSGGPYGPLLVRAPYGFGAVTFLAVDLNRPPLTDWPATSAVVRKIIGAQQAQAADGQRRTRQLTRSGISDLATQLRATQETFPNVERVSLWAIMGLLLAYLLLIGPLDYFLVHRVLQRPRLTWFTFPVLVIAAAALAVWGARTTNGTQVRLNQVDVVDIDAVTGVARVRTWASIYSPETRRYQAEIRPADWLMPPQNSAEEAAGQPPRIVWYGVPEATYGGMYRSGGFEISRPQYAFAPQASAVQNMPVQVWSTRGLTADWQSSGEGLVSSDLTSTGAGQLSGTISHNLGVPIGDWMLAYGNRAYLPRVLRADEEPRPLAPGDVLTPANKQRVSARELASHLTGTTATRVAGRRKGEEEILIKPADYDPLNPRHPIEESVAQIIRMVTFHQAAGGPGYTGLTNAMLGELDLSELVLDLDRAVLFGRIDVPAATILLGGEPVEPSRRSTFVRIVLPVTRQASESQFLDPGELRRLREEQQQQDQQ